MCKSISTFGKHDFNSFSISCWYICDSRSFFILLSIAAVFEQLSELPHFVELKILLSSEESRILVWRGWDEELREI